MTDSVSLTQERTVGEELILGLLVLIRALATYRPDNPVVARALAQLNAYLKEKAPDESTNICLFFSDAETRIEGCDGPASGSGDFVSQLQARELARLFRGLGVASLAFDSTPTETDLGRAAEAIAGTLRGGTGTLHLPASFGSIRLDPLPPGGPNSTGPELQSVTTSLFSGLLSALDALAGIMAANQQPQITPLLRHIRLILQAIDEAGTQFQLLCARRPMSLEEGDTLHAGLRTVEVLGFGKSIGLSHRALLTLGLASCIDRHTARSGPEGIFGRLASNTSLGSYAPGVVTTLADLESLRASGRGGRLAQILHVVDTYVSLSQPQTEDAPAPSIWPLLLRVIPSGRTLISFLQSWKGKAAVGSVVQDQELGQCVVLDLSGPRLTPRLSPFDPWGTLGEPIELTEVPDSAPQHFGRIHLFRMPSDSPEGEEQPGTTMPFPVEGSTAGPTLEKGTRFGGSDGRRFLVERLVGKGGQALVYQIRDSRLGRVAAAKVSTAHESSKRRFFLERFERELLLSSRVTHPNVLQTYDCGELDGGRPYVLLEWMDRGDLGSIIDTAKEEGKYIPLTYVKYYATALASALRSVHGAEIIHRDLKPDNVLIRADGVAKLTDFGVAKDISESAISLTEVGQTMGTLGFMAPEQLMGLPGPQSDIFSFGVTIYFLLCNHGPPQEKLNKIPRGRIEERAWLTVPPSWQSTMRRMTAPELEDRAKDFDEVIELLRDVGIVEPEGRDPLGVDHLPPLPSSELGVVLAALPSETGDVPSLDELEVDSEKWSGIEETIDLPASTIEEMSLSKVAALAKKPAKTLPTGEEDLLDPAQVDTKLPLDSVREPEHEPEIEEPDETLDLDENSD